MRKTMFAVLIVGSILYADTARADFYIPVPYDGLALQLMTVNQFNNVLEGVGEPSSDAPPSSQPDDIAPQSNLTTLSFVPSAATRQQNINRVLQQARANDAAAASELAQLFSSVDVFGTIAQEMAAIGLNANNLADAYAVYWINAWLGSRGRNDDLPPAQFLAVRNQVAAVLLSSPELTAASDAQKQEFAEGLLFQAALISATVESVQSNPEQMAQVQASILQGAQGLGLALNQMTLTAEGFQLDR
jgi:hypothetical protein